MPNPMFWLVTYVVLPTVESLLNKALRSPHFHRGVQRIHRKVEDLQYGRDPNEPLRPGEASREPGQQPTGFFKYFTEEIQNQLKGTPTDDAPPSPKNSKGTKR